MSLAEHDHTLILYTKHTYMCYEMERDTVAWHCPYEVLDSPRYFSFTF